MVGGFSSTPFGVVTTADGRWSFVALVDQLAVMSDRGFAPKLVRLVLPPRSGITALGEALSPDNRYLLAADGDSGADVFSVAALERGAPHPLLGELPVRDERAAGAIEVTVSPDGHYAFVSLEDGAEIAVFDLRAALADRFHRSGFVGMIPVGEAPVGLAISPNGKWLYATSEEAKGGQPSGEGTLSVIDLSRAESDPAKAVVATVAAGCSPVRVAVSPDGSTVWVTARESDALLGFSAARLINDPAHALLTAVRVGEAPVGLALVDGGQRIVVADSNRFGLPGASAGLTVVNPAAALAGRPAVPGTVRAGAFPREMSLEPNGRTLLVTNYGSAQLEAVDVGELVGPR